MISLADVSKKQVWINYESPKTIKVFENKQYLVSPDSKTAEAGASPNLFM